MIPPVVTSRIIAICDRLLHPTVPAVRQDYSDPSRATSELCFANTKPLTEKRMSPVDNANLSN